jgi:hypothetical protein
LGSWALGLVKPNAYLNKIWDLGHLGSIGHLGSWALGLDWVLGYLGSWQLWILGSCALRFFGNLALGTLFLVVISGCAFATSSEWRWQTGKQHVFEYSGRLLTGMPQMASHYSGLGINATVLIDVISQEKFQLSLEHPQFTRVNERLQARNSMDGPDGANWREVLLPEMSEVDSDVRQLLEQPLIFEVVRGEIRAAKISRDEPEWSVNFKKALALLFQTKVDSASWEVQDNQVQ